MKTDFVMIFLILFAVLQVPVALASETSELRAEADQFYLERDFRKAHKIYYKLAKTGDHYSQARLAHMYANGEGKSVDLTEAYAWSVLAEEGRKPVLTQSSESFLQRTGDQTSAKKEALKLREKYGKQALKEKEVKRAEMDAARRSGDSMGSNLSR